MDILKIFLIEWLIGLVFDFVLVSLIVIVVLIFGWIFIGIVFYMVIKLVILRFKVKEKCMVRC